jgi:hypothetical protein
MAGDKTSPRRLERDERKLDSRLNKPVLKQPAPSFLSEGPEMVRGGHC